MIQWLQTVDIEIFRWINLKWANPAMDVIMPFLSGNAFFYPLLAVLAVGFLTKVVYAGSFSP